MSAGRGNGRRARVCLGAFAGAHGVRGDLKVRAFTEREESVAAYGPVESEDGARRFRLSPLRVIKPGLLIARAAGIETREAAEALAGVRFYVDRDALPPPDPGEYYVEDLVGLAAVDETGAPVGRVLAVHDFGAGPVIEIDRGAGAGGALFLPFTDAAAPRIDLAAGQVTIALAAAATGGETDAADGDEGD